MQPLVPLAVLVLTPAVRPFRWSRLFWTYLVPVLPPPILFDGVVSCLRVYTPEEMLAMAGGRRRSLRVGGRGRAPGRVADPRSRT